MTEASAKVCLIPATSLVDGLIIYIQYENYKINSDILKSADWWFINGANQEKNHERFISVFFQVLKALKANPEMPGLQAKMDWKGTLEKRVRFKNEKTCTSDFINHQMFSLVHDWSLRIKRLNMPQL